MSLAKPVETMQKPAEPKKVILVTGGCGFIASNFIHKLLSTGQYYVINVDKMNYCANAKNITKRYNFESHQVENVDLTNYCFYKTDIANADFILDILRKHSVQVVYHFAAQSHVDASFGNAIQFVQDNIVGTSVLLECCREYGQLEKFIHVSTDEVYGSVSQEKERVVLKYGMYDPTNPYASSKCCAELMAKSYRLSYNVPVIITRSNNVYGQHQYYEKVIPRFIYNLSNGKKCPVYGDGQALRKYLYVEDAAEAYLLILEKGVVGQIYEMGSPNEYSALSMSEIIVRKVKPDDDPKDWFNFVEDRKFHDQRYLVNGATLSVLGWEPRTSFQDGLNRTVEWYLNYAIPSAYWPYDDNIINERKN